MFITFEIFQRNEKILIQLIKQVYCSIQASIKFPGTPSWGRSGRRGRGCGTGLILRNGNIPLAEFFSGEFDERVAYLLRAQLTSLLLNLFEHLFRRVSFTHRLFPLPLILICVFENEQCPATGWRLIRRPFRSLWPIRSWRLPFWDLRRLCCLYFSVVIVAVELILYDRFHEPMRFVHAFRRRGDFRRDFAALIKLIVIIFVAESFDRTASRFFRFRHFSDRKSAKIFAAKQRNSRSCRYFTDYCNTLTNLAFEPHKTRTARASLNW